LTLGLDKIPRPPIGVGHPNNAFRTSMPSPMEAYISHGMDDNEQLKQIAYLQQFGKSPYPMQSPSGVNSNRLSVRNGKKEAEQSSVEIIPNTFQTPTSRGNLNQRYVEMPLKREETRSFLPCMKDIAANRVVYNQQRQGSKEVMNSPANYFLNSPYGFTNNYHNTYQQYYANHQNVGSFGASPGYFNVQSPYTGMVPNNMSYFNQPVVYDQRDGSSYEHSSPRFNSIPENTKVPQNKINGQDSARQYNENFIRNLPQANRNFESPAAAFDFSNKSGMHHSSKMSNNSYYRIFALSKLPKK
jgi:hypothetical protein